MTCQCANHTYVRLLTDIFGLCGAKKTPESSPRGQVTRRNRNFTALDEGAPALRSFAYSSNETLLRDSWQQANHLLTALSLTPHRTARNFCGPELRMAGRVFPSVLDALNDVRWNLEPPCH
jgi:hypothetical protein